MCKTMGWFIKTQGHTPVHFSVTYPAPNPGELGTLKLKTVNLSNKNLVI